MMLSLTSAVADGRVLGQDRDPLLALEVGRIQHALVDVLVLAEGAGLPQQRVDERRLAVVDVGDDRQVADIGAAGHGAGEVSRRRGLSGGPGSHRLRTAARANPMIQCDETSRPVSRPARCAHRTDPRGGLSAPRRAAVRRSATCSSSCSRTSRRPRPSAPGRPRPTWPARCAREGAYVPNYYGIGHNSNDNYIAMISGQAPNAQTQADCQSSPTCCPGRSGQAARRRAPAASTRPPCRRSSPSWGRPVSPGAPTTRTWELTRRARRASALTRRSAPATTPRRRPPPTSTPPATTRSCTSTGSSTTRPCATATWSASTARPGPRLGRQHAELQLHHARPLQRRPRRAVQERPARRPGLGQRVPADLGAEDHRLAGLQAGRAADGDLRRGRRSAARLVLRRDPRPGSPRPGINGPGGGQTGAVLLSPCIAAGTVTRRRTTTTRCWPASRTCSA